MMRDDPIERSGDIHDAEGFDPGCAYAFADSAIVVDVRKEKVWAQLIAAAFWPPRYSTASNVVDERQSHGRTEMSIEPPHARCVSAMTGAGLVTEPIVIG
jgi:hypothetical protein